MFSAVFKFCTLSANTLDQKASKIDTNQYVQEAMTIPFDTWDMQSVIENNFLFKEFDLQMTLNYEKTQHNMLVSFSMHLGRENQNSKMIALPYQ